VRTKEALFAELGLSRDNGYSDAQWLAVLTDHPKLLERPIVVYRGRAALGRPPEQVLALLEGNTP
jgi:arsenate reductase (glutaredoxin)